MKSKLQIILPYLIIVISIIMISVLMYTGNQMCPIDTVSYFSGAANYKIGRGWYFSPNEAYEYEKLTDSEKLTYKFKKHPIEKLLYADRNPIGFLYVILIAKSIFFVLGDIQATLFFQVLIHIIIVLICLRLFEQRLQKILFFFLYGINPLIIYYVLFPFNYYWQVLPAFVFTIIALHKKQISLPYFIGLMLIMAFGFVIRPTTVLVILITLILVFLRLSTTYFISALIIVLSFIFFTLNKMEAKTAWHTVYNGIGAYPNSYGVELRDESGYEMYKRVAGKQMNSYELSFDKEIVKDYEKYLKQSYFEILKDNPLLIIKNSILNFFQAFSLGYFTVSIYLSYLSSLVGLIFFIFLLLKKKFLWIFAIISISITFVIYFPPIQAYMFGSYIILTMAFLDLIQEYKIFHIINDKICTLTS